MRCCLLAEAIGQCLPLSFVVYSQKLKDRVIQIAPILLSQLLGKLSGTRCQIQRSPVRMAVHEGLVHKPADIQLPHGLERVPKTLRDTFINMAGIRDLKQAYITTSVFRFPSVPANRP